jgi:tryptophan 2,3-dioxygenase
MEISNEMQQRIEQLQEKYNAMGQDLLSYLDGLLYADYLTYWDYIHLDTLLSLQNPKTSFPDEEIFIMYHQITELYFKLSLHELKQITSAAQPSAEFILARVKRINAYFENLTRSFEIMINGMEVEQFLKFRMSLLPASGFQSAQYRTIEIYATPFIELVDKEVKEEYRKNKDIKVADMYQNIYWKKGATELASGKKTLTLRQFEEKYSEQIIDTAEKLFGNTLYDKYRALSETDQKNEELTAQIKQFDLNVNVNWPLVHFKSAARYLQKNPEDIKATGGTNWQKYLPPRFQLRIFYPGLWTKEELEEWGKGHKNM